MRTIVLIGLVAALGLPGCDLLPTVNRRAVPEAPLPYTARISTERGSPDFLVSVRAGNAPLPAFRESARYEGTRYCLDRFGTSDIDWRMNPASGDWAVVRDRAGNAVVGGACSGR
ncbi:hypothetical protein OCGS_0851 [Oceaniovalibus guishaninsula JLT2003]|uniref:Uncharacterized protein n=1 Tax=Oceaniovalibus guishaninsula JLT2003 TaxID=1231392 RepID=K2GRG2_9RHOB|nr:hypothetical protein [Oceaniovalibus guishaninsula]EKE45156.1 hypothetical protein OCGS_0851 [Oceaniovalibus guishaninsula JLT2003]